MTYKENQLVPELSITNLQKSLDFYIDILGFTVAFKRPEEGFAFITLGNAQLMLDEIGKGRTWRTGELTLPLGRGINFQIQVESVDHLLDKLKEKDIKLFLELEEKWYRVDDHEAGQKQFCVQDPDGYLLRFFEDLGTRKS